MKNTTKFRLRLIISIFLWSIGGYLMGSSFGLQNSFSAELLFSLGALIAFTGFIK